MTYPRQHVPSSSHYIASFITTLLLGTWASVALAEREWIPLASDDPLQSPPVMASTRTDGLTDIETLIPGVWLQRRAEADPVAAVIATGNTAAETYRADMFDRLDVPGFTALQTPGVPQLPLKVHLIEVPYGSEPTVTFFERATIELNNIRVLPAQPTPPDVYPAPPPASFARSSAIYDQTNMFPAVPLIESQIIRIRDKQLLRISVCPFLYNPTDSTISVVSEYNLRIAWEPQSLDSSLIEQSPALPVYMVLLPDLFSNNSTLKTFIEWKLRKGLDVRKVTTSEIDSGGAPTNEQIVNYMRSLADDDYPDYLLILGLPTRTNGVAGAYFNTDTTTYHGYTDLDIACRDDADIYADLYWGRLPASSNNELTTMLNHVMAMDRTPPNSGMFQKALIAGQIQDADDNNNEADRLFAETADCIASYFETNSTLATFSASRAIVNPDGVNANGKWNRLSLLWNESDLIGTRIYNTFLTELNARNRIIDQVNDGIALLQHRDHGYVSGIGWGDPQFLYWQVDALTNAINRPVVFSINCNSGMVNFTNNFSTAWLKNENGGAYAVFAPVDTSYSWRNDWLTHGFYTAFLSDYVTSQNASTTPNWPKDLPSQDGTYGNAGSAWRLGEILNFGKAYMAEHYFEDETTFRLFHLYGDPESQLRLMEPQAITVTHPLSILPADTNLTIEVSATNATVCLYSEHLGIHEVRNVDSSGRAIFPLNLTSSQYINLTVTGRDLRPYEAEILVGIPADSFTFKAVAVNNRVILRWTDPLRVGRHASLVRIMADTSAYPPTENDGRLVYEGTGTKFVDTNAVAKVTQYYSIFATDDGETFVRP